MLKKLADNSRENSVSNKFRRKRFKFFLEFINDMQRPLSILDAGGTIEFWRQMNFIDDIGVKITILNPEPACGSYPGFTFIKGDARDLSIFKDNEFDIVFSNSAIEHVGDINDQQRMANEVMRTGKRYFVQTPNYYFPIEPHFLFPFFQFLPDVMKVFLLKRFNLGWFKKCKNTAEAKELLKSINLITQDHLMKLFKNGKIYKEKFFFLNKSFIIYSLLD